MHAYWLPVQILDALQERRCNRIFEICHNSILRALLQESEEIGQINDRKTNRHVYGTAQGVKWHISILESKFLQRFDSAFVTLDMSHDVWQYNSYSALLWTTSIAKWNCTFCAMSIIAKIIQNVLRAKEKWFTGVPTFLLKCFVCRMRDKSAINWKVLHTVFRKFAILVLLNLRVNSVGFLSNSYRLYNDTQRNSTYSMFDTEGHQTKHMR